MPTALMRYAIVIAAILNLISCGGGDSSSPATSLSVTPNSLSFVPPTTAPRTQSKQLTANFGGDFAIVGYAPGVPQPSWIGVVTTGPIAGSAGAYSVTFTIPVNATGLQIGTYTTSLRVLTGKGSPSASPANANYTDVPITMSVN